MKWISQLGLTMLLFVTPAFTEENMKNETTVVTVETTAGAFELTLYPKIAQKTCENFITLAEKNYYNGTIFHRIIPDFMIQGGDPKGTGTGGESLWGKTFEDEFSKDLTFDKPGILAMANRGPNTNGSQFFITTAKTPWLNMKHTIFGYVSKGYDVIQKIEKTGSRSGQPSSKTEIVKITVKKG